MKNGNLNTIELLKKLDLELSPDFVNYMAKKGRIPAEKQGTRWSYRPNDLRSIKKVLKEYLESVTPQTK